MGISLSLQGVTWAFRATDPPFLKIPRLVLAEGTLTAVSGPSGAGKSTFLFLLAGLERPSTGVLRWGDQDLGVLRGSRLDLWRRRNLGLVFQDFQLIPELSAQENVLLPLTFGRWTISRDDRQRASRLLDRLGVPRAGALASSLSRGEMQRTALARALLGRPGVILADEPTASLDAGNEASVADLLHDYCRQEGATVVVSTHQAALRDRADRVLSLDHGALVGEGA